MLSRFLVFALLLAAPITNAQDRKANDPASRPNIVILFADDKY